MFKTLHRRLRVFLHRYPLLPFLMAATLAVDVTVMNLSSLDSWFSRIMMGSLASQFCLIGIWVVHCCAGIGIRLGVAVVVIAAFCKLTYQFHVFVADTVLTWVNPLAIISAITQIVISAFYYMPVFGKKEWKFPRFTIKDLLILSTSIAMFVFSAKDIAQIFMHVPYNSYVSGMGILITLLWRSSNSNRRLCFILCGLFPFLLTMVGTYTFSNSMNFNSIIGDLIYSCIAVDIRLSIGIVGTILAWSYGLQYRRRPIRHRKKKQQATQSESEQPVELKVVNQENRDEPPGPIDLTI